MDLEIPSLRFEEIITLPREVPLPKVDQCFKVGNGIRRSWKFKLGGFKIFLKCVLSFIISYKPKPTNLKFKGFNCFYYAWERIKRKYLEKENGTYMKLRDSVRCCPSSNIVNLKA